MRPRLALEAVTKRYGSFTANDAVSLTVAPGQIHAVLGENGAGKSTLMKIIYGAIRADAGEIFWEDRQVTIPSPGAARALGIGMVYQHFSLFETVTVVDNIALVTRAGSTAQAWRVRFQCSASATVCRWIRTGWFTTCPSANASGWRFCVACCRSRSS